MPLCQDHEFDWYMQNIVTFCCCGLGVEDVGGEDWSQQQQPPVRNLQQRLGALAGNQVNNFIVPDIPGAVVLPTGMPLLTGTVLGYT
jgi:hypothetical protein